MQNVPRRDFLKALGRGAAGFALSSSAFAAAGDGPGNRVGKRPNVLLICVDDLRPQLECFGRNEMVTPNLDKFAGSACRFTHHYVQVPLCGPSRYTMLAGVRRPIDYSNNTQNMWRTTGPDVHSPMPRLFRDNGYRTVCIGKISHHPGNQLVNGTQDMPDSWDLAYAPVGPWGTPWGAFFGYDGGRIRAYGGGKNDCTMPAFEAADVPDTGYADGLNAEEAIKQLNELEHEPFFLAVGFYKPHLPHTAPKKYWDLYNRDEIELAAYRRPPKNVDPKISLHDSPELTTHYDWPSGPGNVTEAEARRTRHAYFACVSYIDAQIGKVLDELERLELDKTTIVVLWGDHGWHLGDHGIWGKMTTYDYGVQSPLIIRAPSMKRPGTAAGGVVESVDVYPTLTDLCGLDAPSGLDGVSLRPLLDDPAHPGKTGAISSWKGGRTWSLRTSRYRVIEHLDKRGKAVQVELYDERDDPLETANIAQDHPKIVERLLRQLHESVSQLQGSPKA